MEKYMPDRVIEVKRYRSVWWMKMLWVGGGVSDERLQKWLAPEHEAIIREWIDDGGENIPSTWCGYKLAEERKQEESEPEEAEEGDGDDEGAEFRPAFEEEVVTVSKKRDRRRDQVDESEEEEEDDEDDEDDEDEEFKPQSEEEEEVLSKKRKRRVPSKKPRNSKKVIHLNCLH
jgi:hypothetical protein